MTCLLDWLTRKTVISIILITYPSQVEKKGKGKKDKADQKAQAKAEAAAEAV